jgi:hypothetical protein
MPKNNKDIANAYDIPEDSTLSPRSGLLESIRDKIYATEPGRRLMDATDAFNKITGGPDLGNVAPGASTAITPALEKLVNEGVIKKASNLFGKDAGYFMDKMGDVYNLGNIYEPGSVTHREILEKALGHPVTHDLIPALDELGVMRIRNQPGELNLQTSRLPSNAELEQLLAYNEQNPKSMLSVQATDPIKNRRMLGGLIPDFNEGLNQLYKFFGK